MSGEPISASTNVLERLQPLSPEQLNDHIINAVGLDLEGLPEWLLEILVRGDREGRFSQSEAIERVVQCLFDDGLVPEEKIVELLVHPALGISKYVNALENGREFVLDTLERIRRERGRRYHMVERKDWTATAKIFIREYKKLLRHYNNDFLDYRDGAYHVVEDVALEAAVRDFLDHSKCRAFDKKKGWHPVDFNPTSHDIGELIDAVRHYRHIERDSLAPPCWLDDQHADIPAHECISLRNGILHAPSGKFLGPTPLFFTRNTLAFGYAEEATCPLWIATLNQYWPPKDDGKPADEVLLLQEILGYLLLPWTALQKIFFFIGSGRNGKGTIARIIRMLLGESNVAAPSMHSLGTEFGLAPLIGKLAAIVSELAFGARDDRVGITGYLKSISGEDKVEVNRKNSSFWVGVLLTRFVMLANKIPNFADDSTALGARIVALRFNVSFEGREDSTLTNKLAQELPGIFNWALNGYHRLRANLRFTEPQSSRDTRETLKRLASPSRAFVDERCLLDAEAFITEDSLYAAYKNWCMANGAMPDRKGNFIEAVLAGNPGAVSKQRKEIRQDSGKVERPRGLKGIRVLSDDVGPAASDTPGGDDDRIPF